jgi:hypothetical protein
MVHAEHSKIKVCANKLDKSFALSVCCVSNIDTSEDL